MTQGQQGNQQQGQPGQTTGAQASYSAIYQPGPEEYVITPQGIGKRQESRVDLGVVLELPGTLTQAHMPDKERVFRGLELIFNLPAGSVGEAEEG